MIQLATSLALDATGIDVDPEQIAVAASASASLKAVHFVVADATRLPFADCEFDLVHTAKTTHHIRDWPQALAEMVRVLRPGGHLIYRDFVASFGDRLPTRRALNSFAREHRLQPVRRTHSPVTYTVILRKCDQGTNARP